MAAAAPMGISDDDDDEITEAGAEKTADVVAADAEKAAEKGADSDDEAEERDEEEEADVASFLASVSSRNSGAADVAWRLLARVTERWRPSSEGAMRELAGISPDIHVGKNNDIPTPGKNKPPGGKEKGAANRARGGSFGLRHAPRPATLLRLAETFGPGPEGGDPNHKSRMARVHLCLADAATRASVVAAAVARARLAARRRRVPAGGQGVLSKAAAAAATEATEGLPPSHFLDAARTHLSKAVAAAKDDDAVFLAEYHFVAGSLAATETGGSITLAEEHLQAAMDCARAAEESGAYAKDTSGHERLTVANIFAALTDARLHTVVDKAGEELAAGNTGELLATLAPLLLETPSLNERSASRRSPARTRRILAMRGWSP